MVIRNDTENYYEFYEPVKVGVVVGNYPQYYTIHIIN